MPNFNINPNVAPFTGRSNPSVNNKAAGNQIAACNPSAGCHVVSTQKITGARMCPTIKIVKYGGASSARTLPNGAVQFRHTGTTFK